MPCRPWVGEVRPPIPRSRGSLPPPSPLRPPPSRSRRVIALLVGWMATAWPAVGAAESALVAVAANFRGAFAPLASAFQESTGHQVTASFGSSGKIFAQIRHGAPFELFLSADEHYPQRLEREGLGGECRLVYAVGRLVVWSPRPGAWPPGESPLSPSSPMTRLALANPRLAPYGQAAREYLEGAGLWEGWRERLVYGEDAGQAQTFAASGNADAALISLAQLPRGGDGRPVGQVWEVPPHTHTPIRQGALLLRQGADNPAARAFCDFLATPRARRIIQEAGYALP